MAGDWIKMRGNLWDDPRIAKLCDLTDSGEATIVGALYWLWAAADQHTEDGVMPGLSLRQIDRKTGVSGFGQALCDIGWLVDQSEGVCIIGFEEHNGKSAKRRCTDAQRKAGVRNLSASEADKAPNNDGRDADEIGKVSELEKEKRREEKDKPPLVDGKPPTPHCPHLEIIDLYNRILPELQAVIPDRWDGQRAKHLQARWRETPKHQTIEFWEKFFTVLRNYSWYLGDNERGWRANLGWIVEKKNFDNLIEKFVTDSRRSGTA